MMAGWSIYAVADSIWAIVVAELVLGSAMSLISGTDSALLYESLLETGQEEEFGTWTGRMRFSGQFAEGIAALASGILYAAWPRLPFLLQVGVWGAALLVALSLTEPDRHRPDLSGNLEQIRSLLAYIRKHPVLPWVMGLTITLSMASFVPVWSIQLYATDAGVPAAWLGIMWATANLIVAFASLFAARAGRILGIPRLVVVCLVLIGAGFAGLGLVHAWWGFAFYFLLTLMRGLHLPVMMHVEQRLVPSSDRAGSTSFRSFVFRSIFWRPGSRGGATMDAVGQHPVYLALGLLFVGFGAGFFCLIPWKSLEGQAQTPERVNL